MVRPVLPALTVMLASASPLGGEGTTSHQGRVKILAFVCPHPCICSGCQVWSEQMSCLAQSPQGPVMPATILPQPLAGLCPEAFLDFLLFSLTSHPPHLKAPHLSALSFEVQRLPQMSPQLLPTCPHPSSTIGWVPMCLARALFGASFCPNTPL